MAPLRCAAKFDPFLSLDCAPTPSTLPQSKERKGSNFAIWQPCHQGVSRNPNAAAAASSATAVFHEDYDDDLDDLNLSSELDASFGEKGRVHPQQSVWQVERDCGGRTAAAALQQSCWV